jgi:hypothetical protein
MAPKRTALKEKEIGQWTIYIPLRFIAQSPERVIPEVFEAQRFCGIGFTPAARKLE